MASCGTEVRCFHQAVAVAVEVEYARTGDFETAAGVSLRVKFDQLQFVAGEAGNEGNVVVFGHGVVDGDEKLIFHPLQRQLMVFVASSASEMSSGGRVMPQQLTTACPVAWSTLPHRGQT